MKNILFFAFAFIFVSMGCSTTQKLKSVAVTQGITGTITEAIGNQMPRQGASPQEPKGVWAEVLVYEPTNISQVARSGSSSFYTAILTKQISAVQTDSSGHFAIALPVGSYSLFIRHNKGFYSNLFDSDNNIALFVVEENKLTRANLTISAKASY